MKSVFWSWMLMIGAYSIPIFSSLIVGRDPNVLWSYLWVIGIFWVIILIRGLRLCDIRSELECKKNWYTALVTLFVGVISAVAILILREDVNVVYYLTGFMFLLSWTIYGSISNTY